MEGCRVVEREGWKRKVAVAAELVGGANPGEKEKLLQKRKRKKRREGEGGFRGERGDSIVSSRRDL